MELQTLPQAEKMQRYGHRYKWIGKFFGDTWTEEDLKWYAYQDYDFFLNGDYWKFYGPDLKDELFEELKVQRAFDAIHKTHHSKKNKKQQQIKPSAENAIYLLPTHIRVMLWKEGFEKLSYTLPRSTTFEELKALVERDVQTSKFHKFDCGPPSNRFGPGKTFDDVFPPTTVGISHSWE